MSTWECVMWLRILTVSNTAYVNCLGEMIALSNSGVIIPSEGGGEHPRRCVPVRRWNTGCESGVEFRRLDAPTARTDCCTHEVWQRSTSVGLTVTATVWRPHGWTDSQLPAYHLRRHLLTPWRSCCTNESLTSRSFINAHGAQVKRADKFVGGSGHVVGCVVDVERLLTTSIITALWSACFVYLSRGSLRSSKYDMLSSYSITKQKQASRIKMMRHSDASAWCTS